MNPLRLLSPARLIRMMTGAEPAEAEGPHARAFDGISDHLLRDIGLVRDRPTRRWRHDPFL